jgi:glucokinase
MSARGGIDLGGTKIQAVILNGRGTVVSDARRQTPLEGGPPAIAAEMVGALGDAAEAAGVELTSLASLGVGSPGVIDSAAGTVASAGNLSDWSEPFPLARELSKAVGGAPVTLGNDVSVATEAEFKIGAGKPYKSLLGVFWGTGVGGGIVLNGKMWEGRGAAAEIGHIVVKKDGALCPCGRQGCLEAYAGRGSMEAKARKEMSQGRKTSLFKIMEHKGRARLSSGVWAKAIEDGDELAIELVDRAISYLGAGIGSAVNLLDPEAVVIGGGMGVRFGDAYLERIRDATMPHVFADDRPPELLVAGLGDLGGATGAALLKPARPRPVRRSAGAGGNGGSSRSRARR